MTEIMEHWAGKIALLLFVFFTVWWVILQFFFPTDSVPHHLFGGFYGIMALWGGICGLKISQRWGGWNSFIGRAILMFSLGLFAQEFGQVTYFYYNYIANTSIYPSIGDIGFFATIPLYAYGTWLLAKASGVKIGFQSFINKIGALLLPLGLLTFSYFFFLNGYQFDWSKPLTIFLDFGYPLGDAIYVSVALVTYLLSRGVLGGVMKNKILFILFVLVFQYITDFTFLYQNSKGLWHVAQINDYMYFLAYFLMTFGIFRLKGVVEDIKKRTN